mgnify:FL=1
MELFIEIWNSVIIAPMINTLIVLYSVSFSNFGVAIIIFTILIRGLMMPLTVKQSRQMKAMTALQPRIKDIQSKYKNDKQRQSKETMSLYKEQGVNPIGCLGPMFIQFPIWIGLYQAILQTVPTTPERLVGLSGHLYMWLPMIEEVIPLDSSFLWLNLAQPDPKWILPVLVGVSMWFMQKMTTMPAMDDRQASTNRMMLCMMPFMFGFFSLQFPSGLAMYWVISNLAGIVIQGFITGWTPLLEILRLNKVEKDATGTEAVTAVLDVDTHISEEINDEELNRNNGEDGGRSGRNSSTRARRRPRRGRNKRR